MTERRPFPPSPRRLALARQAGLSSASAIVVGAVACVGAVIAALGLGRAAANLVETWIARSCAAAGGSTGDVTSAPASIVPRIIELAAPLLAAAAIAAIVTHVAQTRALWLPRRRIAGAPGVEPARARGAAFDMTSAAIIGVVTFGWLWLTAPRLAALFSVRDLVAALGSAIASLIVALAVAWIVIGVFDALLRRLELTRALAMTVTEKRDDDRLAAADPRWRAQRLAVMRGPSTSAAVARSALLLLGDDVAIAIAWDARRQPVPLRVATGRRSLATQLIGLARRYRVPIHRDAQLAAILVESEGPVPDTHWARLAEIIAAVHAR